MTLAATTIGTQSLQRASELEVLARFFQSVGSVGQVAKHPSTGLSGAAIWRVTLASGGQQQEWALRRWPTTGPPREVIDRIHQVLTQVASQQPTFLPAPAKSCAGETCVEHDGHLWELLPWMPGQPAPPPTSNSTSVEAGGRNTNCCPALKAAAGALAKFHLASQQVLHSEGAPPALALRWDRLSVVTPVNWQSVAHTIDDSDCKQLAVEISNNLNRGIEKVTAELMSLARPVVPLLHVIRDARRDHFLFTAGKVTGLVDFGAMSIDSPMVDLARLLGDWPADELTSWQAALAAYEQIRPMTPCEQSLLQPLDASGTVLACCNWLRWLAEGRVSATPLAAERLEHLNRRLKLLC